MFGFGSDSESNNILCGSIMKVDVDHLLKTNIEWDRLCNCNCVEFFTSIQNKWSGYSYMD